MSPMCSTSLHRHVLTCARCGVTDSTVAPTPVKGGKHWPPTCVMCSAEIREKSARLAAVELVEGLA